MLNENIGILEQDGDCTSSAGITTVANLLFKAAEKYRKIDAFKFKTNGQWTGVSIDDFLLRVEDLFFALRALGLKRGDRVAILSENRVEWAVADYATLCAGGITVPIYPTLSHSQIEVLLKDSEPFVIFTSTRALLEQLMAMQPSPSVRNIICFDSGIAQPGVMKLDALYEVGRQSAYDYPGEFRRSALAVAPDDVATIIYTSGTTGVPKGAMLTHRNLVSNILATSEVLPLTPTDISLSFLPLSHVFQRHVDYASVHAGSTIAYAESLAAVADNMMEVHPTICAGVPRFFEKVYARILSEVARGPLVRRAIFEKAISVGKEFVRTGRPSLAHRAAESAVFRKIRERMGGCIRLFISGGAALETEVAEFFHAIGLPIYEGYGLTETSPVITLNGPAATRLGSVGRPVNSVEVHIADDGEILVRGWSVMKGYYRMAAETAEVMSGEWFHTGDIGVIDSDGYLKITDRKKDLIVTSGGKNIAPQAIENRLKLSPYFENIVVIGDRRKFVSALIVPNLGALAAYARAHGIVFERPAELIHKPEIYDLAMNEIEKRTQDFSWFEKVRKVAFLEKEFTIDGGELTPTLKIRRSFIEKKYQLNIDELYAA
ncbi:MAG TPA: long-chain fatty acid--CoA ligase [Terriglobia bacterium]|nr:long-chain fatty acid--CoA ligase [Terriglobia bacterium]